MNLVLPVVLALATGWPPSHKIPEADAHAALAAASATYDTAEGWTARGNAIRAHVAETLNLAPTPWAGPPPVLRHSRTVFDGYAVENLQVETLPGFFVGANLYIPLDRRGPLPAVLCPHGHKHANAEGAEGRFQPNYQRLCSTLARAGAVVLTWDMVGWGETKWVTHDRPESTALQTYNTIRMIDVVQAMPSVDPSRIGITGSSGGGTQTFLATALDERITVSVPTVMVSAHFFGGCACESGLPIHDDGGDLQTSNVELAALAAPRPMLLISVGGDWTTNTPDIEYPHIKRIYGLFGVGERIANAHFENEQHNYGPSKRAAAVRFLSKHLGLDLAAVTELDGSISDGVKVRPRDDLTAFTLEHPLPTGALQGDDRVWAAFKALPR